MAVGKVNPGGAICRGRIRLNEQSLRARCIGKTRGRLKSMGPAFSVRFQLLLAQNYVSSNGQADQIDSHYHCQDYLNSYRSNHIRSRVFEVALDREAERVRTLTS